MTPLVRKVPYSLWVLMQCLDPTEDGRGIVIAPDLLEKYPGGREANLVEAGAFLDRVLAHPQITNADLKGMLNRCMSVDWAICFEVGGGPRGFLETLRKAISARVK